VETQLREKSLRGSQTQDIHYLEDKVSYKVVALTYPYIVVVPWTLMCNPTRTPPNQVTYLKGSSMESFTLWPTPKIDFSSVQQQHTTTTAWERTVQLNNSKINFPSSTEFNTKFLQITCLGASIYRLQKTKFASNLNFLGCVQTVAEGVRTDNCAISFPNALEILSWIEPHSNGVALASGRLYFSYMQFPY
jgi:hypothetical protein